MFIHTQITIEAMKSDIDEVALQGIEFWSNVCDEEMDLAIEATEVSWVVEQNLDGRTRTTLKIDEDLF